MGRLRQNKIIIFGVSACVVIVLAYVAYSVLRQGSDAEPEISIEQREALAKGQFIVAAEKQYDAALDALFGVYQPFVTNVSTSFWSDFRERERTNVAYIAKTLFAASKVDSMEKTAEQGYDVGMMVGQRLNQKLLFDLRQGGHVNEEILKKVMSHVESQSRRPDQSLNSGLK